MKFQQPQWLAFLDKAVFLKKVRIVSFYEKKLEGMPVEFSLIAQKDHVLRFALMP